MKSVKTKKLLRNMKDIPNLQGPEPSCWGHVNTVAGVSGVPGTPGTEDGVVSHPDPGYLHITN